LQILFAISLTFRIIFTVKIGSELWFNLSDKTNRNNGFNH